MARFHQPVSILASEAANKSGASAPASAINADHTWRLDDIYPAWDAWEADVTILEGYLSELEAAKGRLQEGPERLVAFLTISDASGKLFDKVWYYPALAFDLDQRDNALNARKQRAEDLLARFSAATSWLDPELLALGEETVLGWLDEHDGLADYRFLLTDLFRRAPHVLDESGERVLALSARFGSSPSSAYSALTTADARFPEVTLSDGSQRKVTPSSYGSLLRTLPEQNDRRTVFEAHFQGYADNANTYAALYNGVLQRGIFHARARHYDTVIERKLNGNAIPLDVITTLVDTAKAGMEPMRRYHALRKQRMGLDDYYLFDSFAPLVTEKRAYDYEDAARLVADSVAPLGDDYQQRAAEAFDRRWVDVYEREGKRSGGYMASVHGVHPFILMNYHGTLDNVFTLAHELGHALHSVLSDEAQPFTTSGYTIFIAEVASTLNEALLLDEMLRRAESPRERAVLLQHAIDTVAGTFYTQSLFASYELAAHQLAEAGQPITRDVLSELYHTLINEWYGDVVTPHDLYRYTWTRIPHFYHSPYYVYQYATSYAASAAVFEAMQQAGGEQERGRVVNQYLELLRSGGKDHPMTLLRTAGVDLGQPDAVNAVVRRTGELVDLLENELDGME